MKPKLHPEPTHATLVRRLSAYGPETPASIILADVRQLTRLKAEAEAMRVLRARDARWIRKQSRN